MISDIPAAITAFAHLQPMSPEDYRRGTLIHDIYPALERWGYPERYRIEVAKLHKKQQWAFNRVSALCIGKGAIVALVGLRGRGKTTISALLAIRYAWQNYHDAVGDGIPGRLIVCRYAKASALVARYKAIYSDHGTIDEERLSQSRDYLCRNVEILTIDELHETQDMKMRDRMLADVLDRRYSARRDTLLISNQTPEQFRESTPDSVLSRLEEHGAIIPCDWPSFRTQQ